MQFGMPTLIENHTLEENAALCEALGLRFIELNMNFPEYQVDRLEQTDELVRIAEQHHLYYTVHLDENLNIADFNPLVTQAYLETVRRTILAAKALLPLPCRTGRCRCMSGILKPTCNPLLCSAPCAKNGSATAAS